MILKIQKKKIENFDETLFPKTNNEDIENNLLITVLLLVIRFDKVHKQMFAIFKNSKKVSIQT